MERVAILGLGLIGTSIGLGLRQWAAGGKGEAQKLHVVGFDIDMSQQQQAKRMKATDEMSWDLPSAVRDADLVIVATPVGTLPEVFETIGNSLKHGSVVTDVCSTKGEVMQWAKEKLPTTCSFIGGHPMAGGVRSTEGATATLFNGATWCICPSVRASEEAVQTVLGLIAALGAEPQFIDPHEHDGFVGGVSHLPFVLSSALMNTVTTSPGWRDMKLLSATGFRDVSRLAAGSAEMHRDICLTNRESVLRWLDEFSERLHDFRTQLSEAGPEHDKAVYDFFVQARDARADWSTAERDDGSLAQETANELGSGSISNQFSQMFLGGLLRKRGDKNEKDSPRRPDRIDRR